MSGALSLVKSLRSEVKQLKEKVSQAQAGESTCRRKIELIQRRIGHPVNGDVEELGDFQLEAIVSRQEGGDRNQSPLLGQPTLESASYRVPTSEVFSHHPNIFHEGGVGKIVHGDDEEEGGGELDTDHIVGQERNKDTKKVQELIKAADVGGNDSCNHNDVDSGRVTDNLGGEECAKDTPFCDDALSGRPAPQHVATAAAREVGFDQVPNYSCEEHGMKEMNDNKLPNALIRPSVMLESGMSTAIVVKCVTKNIFLTFYLFVVNKLNFHAFSFFTLRTKTTKWKSQFALFPNLGFTSKNCWAGQNLVVCYLWSSGVRCH